MLKHIVLFALAVIISNTYVVQASEYTLVELNADYIQYKDQYKQLYTYFSGLEPDLFQSLVIRNTKGPKWKEKAEDFLNSENDFHEWASYYGEREENQAHLKPFKVSAAELKRDLARVTSDLSSLNFSATFTSDSNSGASIQCSASQIKIQINSNRSSWSENFYYALHKMGFYFPHPKMQITPRPQDILKTCGKSFQFSAQFKYRGFHLHTLHFNEWVEGFFMNKPEVAKELIRWLARNMQNSFDISLVRMKNKHLGAQITPLFDYARSLGIYPGISLGIFLNQQNSYKLVGIVRAIMGMGVHQAIKKNLKSLLRFVNPSYITLESGTSEFTPSHYKLTIEIMNSIAEMTEQRGIQTFTKIHVSTNQKSSRYGNYNFLPQYTNPNVGIWPHTVMFYDLYDGSAPMYGNKSFQHMFDFMIEQKDIRPTWNYPETSYYIGMDIDAPLLLTSYITTRADEMRKLHNLGIEGQIDFTSGQEVGYWLIDWSVALLSIKDYDFDPYTAIKLLSEDEPTWKTIFHFQDEFFKEKQLISILSFPNFTDELLPKHKIHTRNTIKELTLNPILRENEIVKLEDAIQNIPDIENVKNKSLKLWLKVTFLRLEHALNTRYALRYKKKSQKRKEFIAKAAQIRSRAIAFVAKIPKNYPGLHVFKELENPTSYSKGYGWTARNMYFWRREEQQVLREKFSPFFMNIYEIFDILI